MPRDPNPGQIIQLALGFDPGFASCGLAYTNVRTRQLVDHCVIETPPSQALALRLRLIHQQIALAVKRPGVVAVGYENQLRVGKAKAAEGQTNANPMILARVQGYIESLAWELGLPVYDHEPGDVKVAALGPGARSANKRQVREGVFRLTGQWLSEHAADACGASWATARRFSVESRLRLD